MRKRQTAKLKILLGLLAVAAVAMCIRLSQARAQDSDRDGFTDQQEIEGITLVDGSRVESCLDVAGNYLCDDPTVRRFRLDPETPDLFVILVQANPSSLPANPLEFVTKSLAEGGLGITIHEISPAQAGPDREITPTQKAVRVTESLDTSVQILGIANYGTPNQLDQASVFTERIRSYVSSVCANATNYCGDDTGLILGPDAIADVYIKHTIAHEIGHMLSLAAEYNKRFGGYHYKSGSQVIMEQSVMYTSKSKGRLVTFYMSTDYAAPDLIGAVLK